MIPLPVVSHWPLDRKRSVILIGDDQIERFAGHGPISWFGIAEHVGDRVLRDRNLLQRSHAGHKPRAMRQFGWCHHRVIEIPIRNDANDVRAGATIILSAGVVRVAPFVEAIRTTEAFGKLSAEEIRISVILP